MDRPGEQQVAERLLLTVREELGRADTKASILLTGATAILVVTLSWQVETLPPWPASAAVLGVALWTAGIAMLAAAVLPRRRAPGRSERSNRSDRPDQSDGSDGSDQSDGSTAWNLTFFADLTGGASAESLLPRVERAGREPARWMVEQACNLGAILAVKYGWLRRGVCCLAVGGLFLLAARMLS